MSFNTSRVHGFVLYLLPTGVCCHKLIGVRVPHCSLSHRTSETIRGNYRMGCSFTFQAKFSHKTLYTYRYIHIVLQGPVDTRCENVVPFWAGTTFFASHIRKEKMHGIFRISFPFTQKRHFLYYLPGFLNKWHILATMTLTCDTYIESDIVYFVNNDRASHTHTHT